MFDWPYSLMFGTQLAALIAAVLAQLLVLGLFITQVLRRHPRAGLWLVAWAALSAITQIVIPVASWGVTLAMTTLMGTNIDAFYYWWSAIAVVNSLVHLGMLAMLTYGIVLLAGTSRPIEGDDTEALGDSVQPQ